MEEQLLSVLNQTYSNLELVICDDASTDATFSILSRYSTDPRVRLFANDTNRGPYKSFEKVVAQCKGAYIALCDQDDVWLPQKLERMIAAAGPELLLYHDSLLVNEKGRSLHTRISDRRNLYSGTDPRGFVFSNCVWGHAAMFRRELLQQALPFPEGIPHDVWLAFAAACHGGIRSLPEVLVHYRQHGGTVTTTLPPAAVKKRKSAQKQAEFSNTLRWIEEMKDACAAEYKDFFTTLHGLYLQRRKGFSFPLFWFLLKHRKALFRFTKKSPLSVVNEIRKQARAVAP